MFIFCGNDIVPVMFSRNMYVVIITLYYDEMFFFFLQIKGICVSNETFPVYWGNITLKCQLGHLKSHISRTFGTVLCTVSILFDADSAIDRNQIFRERGCFLAAESSSIRLDPFNQYKNQVRSAHTNYIVICK